MPNLCARPPATQEAILRPVCLPRPVVPCRWCRERQPAFEDIRAPFLFQGAIKTAVYEFKYRGVKAAAPQLAQLLANYLKSHPLAGHMIIPVPLDRRRLKGRGYNQSAVLAKELAKVTGIEVESRLLKRTKDALSQVHTASKNQRRDNVAGSFSCSHNLSGKSVILIDDIATTGSTLSACASALKDSGAASVWGLVLARGA